MPPSVLETTSLDNQLRSYGVQLLKYSGGFSNNFQPFDELPEEVPSFDEDVEAGFGTLGSVPL